MRLFTVEELKAAIQNVNPDRARNMYSLVYTQRFVWRALITCTGNRLKVVCRECKQAYGICRCPEGGEGTSGGWRYSVLDKYVKLAAVKRWGIDPESLQGLKASSLSIKKPGLKKLVWELALELARMAEAEGQP